MPTIFDYEPTASATLSTSRQHLRFKVTDAVALLRVFVKATLVVNGVSVEEVVHDGDAYGPAYVGNSRTPGTYSGNPGFQYDVLRNGGWPSAVTLKIVAIDTSGNEVVG